MSNLEKFFWLGLAGYGVYSAGKAFTNQYKKVEKQGADVVNLLVLAGTFVIGMHKSPALEGDVF